MINNYLSTFHYARRWVGGKVVVFLRANPSHDFRVDTWNKVGSIPTSNARVAFVSDGADRSPRRYCTLVASYLGRRPLVSWHEGGN